MVRERRNPLRLYVQSLSISTNSLCPSLPTLWVRVFFFPLSLSPSLFLCECGFVGMCKCKVPVCKGSFRVKQTLWLGSGICVNWDGTQRRGSCLGPSRKQQSPATLSCFSLPRRRIGRGGGGRGGAGVGRALEWWMYAWVACHECSQIARIRARLLAGKRLLLPPWPRSLLGPRHWCCWSLSVCMCWGVCG